MILDSIIKGFLSPVLSTVDRLIPDKTEADKLKAEIQLAAMSQDSSALENELNRRARVIMSETQGKSWLQRNWRPVLMLTFTYIIAHNYVLAPIFSLPSVQIPPDMWQLLKLGIGGYIVGRSAEKIAGNLPGKK